MRFVTQASSFILAGLAMVAAADDLTVVAKHTRGDEAPTTTTSYFTSEKMRTTGGRGEEMIADYASGNMTVLDNNKKEYFVITPQDMEAAQARMAEANKEMEAKLQNVPPEMRERIASMTGGGGAASSVDVQKGTGGRTIAGYQCQNWIVTMGKMMRQDSCVSTDVPVPPGVFEGMKRFAQSMGAAGPMGKSMGSMWEKFKQMKGYPLANKTTVSVMGKDTVSTTEVTDIKKGPVPASVFEIPVGYKKVDSPMAKMGQAGKRK
jgi:hypothetical protein